MAPISLITAATAALLMLLPVWAASPLLTQVAVAPVAGRSLALHPTGLYAYAGAFQRPGTVAKLHTSNMSVAAGGSLQLSVGPVTCALIDPVDQAYVLWGTWDMPASIVRVTTGSWEVGGSITLNAGEGLAWDMVTNGTHAFVGMLVSPGILVAIK
jgi:hypothetical protein